LGILHYSFIVGIFIYIIGINIIYDQRYLKTEVPFGSVRATLQEPTTFKTPNQLPYCPQYQSSIQYNSTLSFQNFECIYALGVDVTYPTAQRGSLFGTTRLKTTLYPPPPANCTVPPTDPACLTAPGNVTRYWIADIEDFTVFIEHAVYGQLTGVAARNIDCKGEVFSSSGDRLLLLDSNRTSDIFTISQLLSFAKLPSLDVPSQLVNSANSMRYDGCFILVIITYSNRQSATDSYQLKYNYQFVSLPGLDVVQFAPTSTDAFGNTVENDRHGVNFVFLVTGTVGEFDFPQLLTSLVNGFVLTKFASVIVDLLLLYVLPQRNEYKTHKIEITEEYADMRKRRHTQNVELESLPKDTKPTEEITSETADKPAVV